MFDMHGNVWAWCHSYRPYEAGQGGKASEDDEDSSVVTDSPVNGRNVDSRVLRGTVFDNQSKFLRSANRGQVWPGNRYFLNGVRPARTHN
ncbi:MAG: SUMF1/EgtB/PvdO family nonheme iron enzyme [Thermoguttaceae bacterium]